MTSSVAVITIDHVLRDISEGGPIPTGRRIYHALAEAYRLMLIADTPVDPVWLAVNGFDQHQHVIDRLPEDPGDVAIRRIRQIERLRAMGGSIELLVDPDPGVVAAVVRTGCICLHYVDPPYARPEFHPDFEEVIKPWDQMVTEIDKTKAARATDTRIQDLA